MNKTLLITITIFPLFLFMSCPDDKNEPIELEIYETYCTSIELKITMQDSLKEKEYSVKRNDSLISSGTITDNQIIITDENLEPNTQYSYIAYSKNDESEIVTAITMDTTSHDFVWEIDTLGNYGSSLRDVAIIDENNIWVVGEIRTDSANYNAANWDGNKWNYVKILSGNSAVYSIKYFSEDDIWVSDICSPIHWDGNEWTLYHLQNMGLDVCAGNSIWGSSSDDMYFAGRNGDIVHYDGNSFTKLETGLEIEGHYVDIDGTENGEKVFVVIYQHWHDPHKGVVFQIEDETVTTLFYSDDNTNDYEKYNTPISTTIVDNYAYTKLYNNLWIHNTEDKMNKFLSINDYNVNEMTKLFGNNHNDLYGVGADGWFMHYNGNSWKCTNWETEYGTFFNGNNYKNVVIIVGDTNNSKGIIIKGRRN